MRPCKRDTCLYKWEEEAHFGTVLAELRGNPLAMHAELLALRDGIDASPDRAEERRRKPSPRSPTERKGKGGRFVVVS